MKNKIILLTEIDFLRSWSPVKIIIAVILSVLACVLSALPVWMGWINKTDTLYMPFNDYLIQVWKVIIPFSVLFFTSGIISNDIKNHWLRTVITHAVTKQDVILSKILSSLVSVIIIMIILGIFPILVFSFTLGNGINFDFAGFIQLALYSSLEATLFISIATWLSCFLGGFMNIFVLAFWMFLDNVVMKGILTLWLSNSFTGTVIVDFFFPSGFSEAAVIASSSGTVPFEFILWGIAALMFFVSASLYHFNRLTLDINSD